MTDIVTGPDYVPPVLTDAEKLTAIETYLKTLTAMAKTLRATVTADMGTRRVERVGAYLPDGEKMGAVGYSTGRKSVKVTDEAAALAWCQNRYPGEVVAVEMIRPAFLKKLLDTAKALPVDSAGVDPATGELLDFIQVSQGDPFVTVTTTDEGVARMETLAHGFAGMLEAPTVVETGPGGGTIKWSDGKVTYPDWTGQ